MESQELELFLHAGGRSRAETAVCNESLRDVLMRFAVLEKDQDGIFVFLGECEEALDEPADMEGGADQQTPVDIDLTLEVLCLKHHRHVHVHHCRHIVVEVSFGTKTIKRKFSPATTIEVVTRWAKKKFKLDEAAGTDYVLQICGTKTQPRSDQHLSQVVHDATCSICFDVVTEVNPQG